MKQARDSQRSKLYKAERAVWKEHGKPLPTVPDIDRYLDALYASKRFAKAFPKAVWWKRPRVTDGRGRRAACAVGTHTLKIPVWARNSFVVIHELAHVITLVYYAGNFPASHGWQFAMVYLELIRITHGRKAHADLKQSFRQHRVKFKAPRAKRVLSDAQRRVLVERMAVARAAKERGK